MVAVIEMFGLPGSGKSTFLRKIEVTGYARTISYRYYLTVFTQIRLVKYSYVRRLIWLAFCNGRYSLWRLMNLLFELSKYRLVAKYDDNIVFDQGIINSYVMLSQSIRENIDGREFIVFLRQDLFPCIENLSKVSFVYVDVSSDVAASRVIARREGGKEHNKTDFDDVPIQALLRKYDQLCQVYDDIYLSLDELGFNVFRGSEVQSAVIAYLRGNND